MTPTGPWVGCPRCDTEIALSRFADDDDEPGISVGICPSCSERVHLIAPPE